MNEIERFNNYFWPKIIKEIKECIKTRDVCQRIEKSEHQKKVSLKLNKIITIYKNNTSCGLTEIL